MIEGYLKIKYSVFLVIVFHILITTTTQIYHWYTKNANMIVTKEIKTTNSTTKDQHLQNANKLPLVVSPYCQRPTTVTIAGVSYLEKDSVKDFFEILEEVML